MSEKKLKRIKTIVENSKEPIRGVSFGSVIKFISGHEVTPYDPNNPQDLKVMKVLTMTAMNAGKEINKKGILRSRANEVGNDIEKFVKNELNKLKYTASNPHAESGKMKATGYPDIEFQDEFKRTNYVECKSFNKKSAETSFRSFYLSPSDDFKITKDAHHYLVAFEIYVDKQIKEMNLFKCKSWKVLALDKLVVDFKCEFNTSNKKLYKNSYILASGEI